MIFMHSEKFDLVKKYYKMGFWNERKVRDAVTKGWITSDEFYEITGKDF